ncbi:cupin domain-containing protein [Conyzicola sp.]|uniref:cupin domain-containing protein n=1 Tax=Conyzicola sp. TaxID=1969404 RepID=UPI003988E33F
METIDFETLTRVAGGTARFEGEGHGSSVSFFVVRNQPGDGAAKHRHPYDETFVIIEGEIEVIVDDELRMLGAGTIAVVPAGAWHEFTNRSDRRSLMVNIHASSRIIQEDWEG